MNDKVIYKGIILQDFFKTMVFIVIRPGNTIRNDKGMVTGNPTRNDKVILLGNTTKNALETHPVQATKPGIKRKY